MIQQAIINERHKEIYEKYADKHIDDYDVFVKTRVVEYFLNKSQDSADTILELVDLALMNASDISSISKQEECEQSESKQTSSANATTADNMIANENINEQEEN